jgi:hypothetical protein
MSNCFDLYLNPPTSVGRVIAFALSQERGSPAFKQAWKQIFSYARQLSDLFNTQLNREIDPEMIVDSWSASSMWLKSDGNSVQLDDTASEFVSLSRSLTLQWERDYSRQKRKVDELTDQYLAEWHCDHDDPHLDYLVTCLKDAKRELTIIHRLKPTVADFTSHEEFGDDCQFTADDWEYAEDYARNLDNRDSFRQEAEVDPDDARFLGTPPRANYEGYTTFEAKMKSDYRDRGRGADGVLMGFYERTLPEPATCINPYQGLMQGGRLTK